MDYLFSFEKLQVWQDSRELVKSVYSITRNFPQSELYGLTSQINRAVVSVSANLAEGSARVSRKDQAHFSQLSYSSLMETACLLIIATDLSFISEEILQGLRSQISSIAAKITALRSSQLRRSK